MLRQQRELQARLGYDFMKMTRQERIDHIKIMYIAAVKELGEALDETTWKPWAVAEEPSITRNALASELSDTWQFIMNMWFAVYPGLSDEELASRMVAILEAKLAINEARRVGGYDGISTKCGQCKRALDDPAVSCTRTGDQGWCESYQVNINYIKTIGDSDRVDREIAIVPSDQRRDTVAS